MATAATPRRKLLRALVAIPLVAGAASAVAATRRGIVAARPRPIGRSAALCGACGSSDHSMLDPACPATPRPGSLRVV
jgi:hypothetical protein